MGMKICQVWGVTLEAPKDRFRQKAGIDEGRILNHPAASYGVSKAKE